MNSQQARSHPWSNDVSGCGDPAADHLPELFSSHMSPRGEDEVLRAAFAKLIQLCRRRSALSIEQLSTRADVDVAELLQIEAGAGTVPEPRTVYMLAHTFALPTECLIRLSGQLRTTDAGLQEAAHRLLASTRAEQRLSRAERRSLGAFLTILRRSQEKQMATKNVHVVPAGSGWAVKREGRVTPLSNHRTQQTAEAVGRRVARAGEGELVIHRPNGQIRDKDSYGRDPNPPRDRKH